jgi:hypothetical protein
MCPARLALIVMLLGKRGGVVTSKDVEGFKERIQFSRIATMGGVDGVKADWDDLSKELSAALKPKRLVFSDSVTSGSALMRKQLVWRKGDASVLIWVFVSGSGFAPVRERLLYLVTETTRPDIPYDPGPSNLGDLAIQSADGRADTIIWVYRNVCVCVRDANDSSVESIARIIQSFMERHHVARMVDHLPRVDRVDASARQVRVGDEWRVAIRLGKATLIDSVTTDIHEVFDESGGYRLESVSSSGLEAIYRATAPGTARVDIRVVDRKTLLSPPLSVTLEILPAL